MAKKSENTEQPQKILVVDDDEQVRISIEKAVEVNKLQIATAANVGEALHLIEAEPFDVLLSDLHMTEEGDGLSAVSAMHKTNPQALTLVYTGYPELKRALDVIVETDGLLVKPEPILPLPEPSSTSLENRETRQANLERVAAILERDVFETVIDWLDRVERDGELTRVPLGREERTGHLPQLIRELAYRLQVPRRLRAKTLQAAAEHGRLRYIQGYWISMIVEESRMLQICIFETLYNSLSAEDFRVVLSDAKTITEECNSQLEQTLAGFTRQAAKRVA